MNQGRFPTASPSLVTRARLRQTGYAAVVALVFGGVSAPGWGLAQVVAPGAPTQVVPPHGAPGAEVGDDEVRDAPSDDTKAAPPSDAPSAVPPQSAPPIPPPSAGDSLTPNTVAGEPPAATELPGPPVTPAPAVVVPAPPPAPGSPFLVVPPSPALDPGWAWVDTVPTPEDPGASPPRRSPFRGSRFDWTHSATTTLLGVGADYQSSAYQIYRQGYSLLLNYFVYDGETIRVRLSTAPGMDVEMTNSDITTSRREPLFRDLPVAIGVNAPVARNDENLTSTVLAGNLVVVAPTSKLSRAAGSYLTVSPRINVNQQLPLRGPGAEFLDDVELWAQLRYDHLFSRAATPVDSDLRIPRRTGGASAPGSLSDVLNGSQIAPNGFRVEGSALFSEQLLGRPLMLSISADYTAWVLAGVTEAQAAPATDPVTADPNARTVRKMVGVGVDVTWQVTDYTSLSIGYGNTADLDNVPSNNPLYTPYAAFLAGLVVHVDSVLESIISRDKNSSPLTRRGLAFAPGVVPSTRW